MKFEIASKNKEIKELEKIAEKIQDMEEFAEWRKNQIYEKRLGKTIGEGFKAETTGKEEDIDKEITASNLRKFNITSWRAEFNGKGVVKVNPVKEYIEREIRRIREQSIQEN